MFSALFSAIGSNLFASLIVTGVFIYGAYCLTALIVKKVKKVKRGEIKMKISKKALGWIIAGVISLVGIFAVANYSALKSGFDSVKTDIAQTLSTNHDLAITTTDKATVVVTDENSHTVTAGNKVLVDGKVYTITVTATQGFTATIKVNGITFTSGNTFTANGDIAIVVTTAASAQ